MRPVNRRFFVFSLSLSFLMVREDGTASAASGSRTKKRVKEKRREHYFLSSVDGHDLARNSLTL